MDYYEIEKRLRNMAFGSWTYVSGCDNEIDEFSLDKWQNNFLNLTAIWSQCRLWLQTWGLCDDWEQTDHCEYVFGALIQR